MIEFLAGDFVVWLPGVFYGTIFATAAWLYFFRADSKLAISSKVLNLRNLIIGTLIFKGLYAILLSVGQYYLWTTSTFTQYLINSPLSQNVPENFLTQTFPALFASNSGYFLYYAYGRFILNPIIAIGIAFLFYLFLKSLQKYQERFFDSGETELGFLCALLVGWPGFVIFVPVAFACVVLVSLFRGIFLGEAYTTLGTPFLLATLVCLSMGAYLIEAFNLTVLKI